MSYRLKDHQLYTHMLRQCSCFDLDLKYKKEIPVYFGNYDFYFLGLVIVEDRPVEQTIDFIFSKQQDRVRSQGYHMIFVLKSLKERSSSFYIEKIYFMRGDPAVIEKKWQKKASIFVPYEKSYQNFLRYVGYWIKFFGIRLFKAQQLKRSLIDLSKQLSYGVQSGLIPPSAAVDISIQLQALDIRDVPCLCPDASLGQKRELSHVPYGEFEHVADFHKEEYTQTWPMDYQADPQYLRLHCAALHLKKSKNMSYVEAIQACSNL